MLKFRLLASESARAPSTVLGFEALREMLGRGSFGAQDSVDLRESQRRKSPTFHEICVAKVST